MAVVGFPLTVWGLTFALWFPSLAGIFTGIYGLSFLFRQHDLSRRGLLLSSILALAAGGTGVVAWVWIPDSGVQTETVEELFLASGAGTAVGVAVLIFTLYSRSAQPPSATSQQQQEPLIGAQAARDDEVLYIRAPVDGPVWGWNGE
jgi:hypothetical protein